MEQHYWQNGGKSAQIHMQCAYRAMMLMVVTRILVTTGSPKKSIKFKLCNRESKGPFRR